MEAEQYLSFLANQIHTVIAATSDSNGHPVTCAIDIMDSDADSLYFLTARGKSFYHRLKEQQFIALTGIKGNDTMSSVAISIRGHVEESNVLERLLRKNQYMSHNRELQWLCSLSLLLSSAVHHRRFSPVSYKQ